jgi:mycobactin peptide synthetase MbtF
VLRSRLDRPAMTLLPAPATGGPSEVLTEVEVSGDLQAAVADHTAQSLESLDPERGVLLAAVWLRSPNRRDVLLLTAHVLAMDPASWRVVLGELDAALSALAGGHRAPAFREHTSYRRWARVLTERAKTLDTVPFWCSQLDGDDPDLGARRVRPDRDRARDLSVRAAVSDADLTGLLLNSGIPMPDLLLAAASRMVTSWRRARGQPTPPPLLAVETHGRADAVVDGAGAHTIDTTDTVGLLSAIYPLRVPCADPREGGRGTMPGIRGDGLDYGLLRYLRSDTADQLGGFPGPQLLLNYLGRADLGDLGGLKTGLRLDRELLAGLSPLPEPDLAVRHELSILATLFGAGDQQVLVTQWRALPDILNDSDIAALQELWVDSLREVVA